MDKLHLSGSLRRTLMVSLISSAALLAVFLVFVVRSYAAQIAQQSQDSILEASVTSILDAAAIRNGSLDVELPYAAFSVLNTTADDRIFYAIYQDDSFLSGYEQLQHIRPPTGQTQFGSIDYADTSLRVARAARELVGANIRTTLSVTIGQTQDAQSVVLRQISRNAALFGLGFFLLTVLLSIWVTNRTIRPLTRLAESVKRRGPQDLRPLHQFVPSEMGPLVGSLNKLMTRLEHSLKQSEDFIAEAAHRVRTPLATVRSYAESTLQRVEKAENRQALRSMVRAIDESSRAAGQLLDHAMITFRADHLDAVDLDLVDLTQDLVTRMTPVADMKDVALHLMAPAPVQIKGDAILLQNAVRNLIDNALKYAPSETTINIQVTAHPIRVIVCDTGPGFPQDDIDTLTNRFTRGGNATGIIGSGLGLTIAKDVARAHGGDLTLSNQPEGGACATLSL